MVVYVALLRGINVGGNNKIDMKQLKKVVEQAILANFGLPIKVLIRSLDEMSQVIAALPEAWRNDQQMRSEVMFLWDDLDNETVLEQLGAKPGIDTVKYTPGAILWSLDKTNVNKSGLRQLIGSKLYKQMTIRNVNTTRKIYELMQATE